MEGLLFLVSCYYNNKYFYILVWVYPQDEFLAVKLLGQIHYILKFEILKFDSCQTNMLPLLTQEGLYTFEETGYY